MDFINPLISAASGLIGVWLGGWLSDRRDREKRDKDFITRQLAEFYGPLVSMRTEIRSRGELRVKIEKAQDSEYITGLPQAAKATDPMMVMMQDEFKIFTDVSMPLYRKMIETFRERMWLAESETRGYFPALIEFVDVWERHIRGTIPIDVITAIAHSEENLHPLYSHLEATHDRLRAVLAGES
jgi:hypothetical protein